MNRKFRPTLGKRTRSLLGKVEVSVSCSSYDEHLRQLFVHNTVLIVSVRFRDEGFFCVIPRPLLTGFVDLSVNVKSHFHYPPLFVSVATLVSWSRRLSQNLPVFSDESPFVVTPTLLLPLFNSPSPSFVVTEPDKGKACVYTGVRV